MVIKRVVVGSTVLVGSLVVYDKYNPGFKRSIQFWSTLGPTILEYQSIKYLNSGDDKILDLKLNEFHERTAQKTLGNIISLGGIYVKIGQV